MHKKQRWFSKLSFVLIFYVLLVILWGAWVRISFSGDGCGDHWPLCHGEILPTFDLKKTSVEYAHRMMSGLFGFYVLGLFFLGRKTFPKGSLVRSMTFLTLVFTVTEALLGAKLVLLGLVGTDDSGLRAFSMTLHLINSLILVGCISLMWDFSRSPSWTRAGQFPFAKLLTLKKLVSSSLLAMLLIGTSGAVAALSTTLFPSQSLLEGLRTDFTEGAHFLLRLRFIHPLLGAFLGLGFFISLRTLASQVPRGSELAFRSRIFANSALFAVAVGITTLLSLSPAALKILHLSSAYLFWITMVLWLRALIWQKSAT